MVLHQQHEVSIPKWCDYKVAQSYQSNYPTQVSIPKWCDYKGRDYMHYEASYECFNSKMVRL